MIPRRWTGHALAYRVLSKRRKRDSLTSPTRRS